MALAHIIADLLRRWRRPPLPSDPTALGAWGEQEAADYLRRNGYRVLYRNYRAERGGEVDIIAREKATATLCFIEVKTRSTETFGRPSLAVDEKKQRLIIRGAVSWLRLLNRPDIAFRFDIVEVVVDGENPQVRHLVDAFIPPAGFFY